MPYKLISKWEEPEIFLEHNGIKVYYTYPDDNISNEPNTHTYTLYAIENLYRVFDVRNLKTYNDNIIDMNGIKNAIRTAIDSGELKIDTRGLSRQSKEKLLTSSKH